MDELQDKVKLALSRQFIGDIIFSDEELNRMRNHCRAAFITSQARWSRMSSAQIEELLVLIINIAKTWDTENENRFWTMLFDDIFENGNILPSGFYSDFESVLKAHGYTIYKSKEGKRRFREILLLHGFSPDASSEAMIKLLWSWFSDLEILNFEYQPDDIIFEQMADYLASKFTGSANPDDNVVFEGNTYTIKAAFKYLFMQDRERGIVFLKTVFSLFDEIYYNNRIPEDSYLAKRCADIVRELMLMTRSRSGGGKHAARGQRVISDFSKIRAFYEIDSFDCPVITLPETRAIDEPADKYTLAVYQGTRQVYERRGYITGEGLKRRIKSISVPMDKFIDVFRDGLDVNIQLWMEREDEPVKVYDSGETLYRDFILFRGRKEMHSSFCKPGSFYLVTPVGMKIEHITQASVQGHSRFFSTVSAEENDYIATDRRRVIFNEKAIDSHFSVNGKAISGVSYIENDIEYPVITNPTALQITLNPGSRPVGIMLDNGTVCFPLITKGKKLGSDGLGYIVDLSVIGADTPGPHRLIIRDISKSKILHELCYYAARGLHFSTRGYAFDTKKAELEVFRNNLLTSSRVKAGGEYAYINHEGGRFKVDSPYIKWRVDDEDWNYRCSGISYWHEDRYVHNNCILEIVSTCSETVHLMLNDTEVLPDSTGKFHLGDAISALHGYNRFRQHKVMLTVGKACYTLFTISNEEKLTNFSLDTETGLFDVSPWFFGGSHPRFCVELENVYDEDCSYRFECGKTHHLEEKIRDGEYDITISLLDYSGGKKHLYNESERCLGNPDKYYFDGQYLQLSGFKNPGGKGKIKLNQVEIRGLEYLRTEGDMPVYSGTLYNNRKTSPVEVYMNSANSFKIFYVKNDNLYPMNYCISSNRLTDESSMKTMDRNGIDVPVQNTDIIPVNSVYCKTLSLED